jgi:hypothetical protein
MFFLWRLSKSIYYIFIKEKRRGERKEIKRSVEKKNNEPKREEGGKGNEREGGPFVE